MHLNRIELLARLNELEFYPEFKIELNRYLAQYIYAKDLHVIELLLKAGADPNPEDSTDCFLYHLMHEYEVTKSTASTDVLAVVELILQHGTNPNRVVMNNQRAFDYSVSEKLPEFEALLLKYGAHRELREWI